jgi:hypothetical protein
MQEKYINDPDCDFEKVKRASGPCGRLVKWLKTQVFGKIIIALWGCLRNRPTSVNLFSSEKVFLFCSNISFKKLA